MREMKIANIIFMVLGFIVVVCGILNILNYFVGNFQYLEFALAYLQTPEIPVVAIALIAIVLGMIIKGAEDFMSEKTPRKMK